MTTDVVVCNGCCCGNTDKGHPVVPIDFLTNAWDEKGLNEYVKLRISRCLGPCSMHNVSLLRYDGGQEWLGKLSDKEHYEALLEWASNIAQNGKNRDLPEILSAHRFERFEEVIVRD